MKTRKMGSVSEQVGVEATSVADMLPHSLSLPLIIDHVYEFRDMTAEDEKGITLAFKQRDRVRRIRLMMSVPIYGSLSWP